MCVVVNMAVYKLCKKLNFITIYNAYILKKHLIMASVIFFTVRGQRLWDMVKHVGNRYNMYFMSPSEEITVGGVRVRGNTVAVVLDTMSKEEMASLQKALLDAFLVVVRVSEDDLKQWMRGSEVRMESFLKSASFQHPPSNTQHLILPLCNHASINPDTVSGMISTANAKLAVTYVFCYMLWGATCALDALKK